MAVFLVVEMMVWWLAVFGSIDYSHKTILYRILTQKRGVRCFPFYSELGLPYPVRTRPIQSRFELIYAVSYLRLDRSCERGFVES